MLMASITPVPEGVKVPTDAEARAWADNMRVAMRSRKGRVAPMTARSAEIMAQLATPATERTFLPVGWPKDSRSVAVLAELRRTDANWTWDKSTKLVWLDGAQLMVAEVADRLGVTDAPKVSKPRKASTFRVVDGVTVPVFDKATPAPTVPKVPPRVVDAMVATVVVEPVSVEPVVGGWCERCTRDLPAGQMTGICQTCQDSLADDVARRPVSLGGDGGPLAEYLGRLIYEPKRLYALELVAHLRDGAPAPVSDAQWAPKVDAKVRRYLHAA